MRQAATGRLIGVSAHQDRRRPASLAIPSLAVRFRHAHRRLTDRLTDGGCGRRCPGTLEWSGLSRGRAKF